MLAICGWCKRVRVDDVFVHEDLSGVDPKTCTHTVCPPCIADMLVTQWPDMPEELTTALKSLRYDSKSEVVTPLLEQVRELRLKQRPTVI